MSKTTRVVLLTDLHLRSDYLPGYLDAQLKTLTRLVNQKPTDVVVINGDIFHKRNPRGSELLAFRELLEGLKCQKIYINRGNHDTVAKDGSTATTLSLYSDIATVFAEIGTAHIGGVAFDFIPHFEDEELIVGHIHKPQQIKNTTILGTQYSTSYGEANTQKYIHELLIRDGKVRVIKKPIEFGIKHIISKIDELPAMNQKYKFSNFFTILRLKLDYLDSATEQALKDDVLTKYSINHLEFAFDDILPKFDSGYAPTTDVFSIDDDIISKYIKEADTVFSQSELLKSLEDIRNHEN